MLLKFMSFNLPIEFNNLLFFVFLTISYAIVTSNVYTKFANTFNTFLHYHYKKNL